jgi:hypothetical protein
MTFHRSYAAAAAAVLAIELGIAAFLPDGLVRSHGGDMLAVLLVYFALRSVTPLGTLGASGAALATAAALEAAQWLRLGDQLGWSSCSLARIVLGNSFDPIDLVAYAAGAGLALAIEAAKPKRPS